MNIDLRDWFAGQALAGSMAHQAYSLTSQNYAQWAYEQADAMLAERAKTAPQLEEEIEKSCTTCRYSMSPSNSYPCNQCINGSGYTEKWEATITPQPEVQDHVKVPQKV
jgi:hypothetical protein